MDRARLRQIIKEELNKTLKDPQGRRSARTSIDHIDIDAPSMGDDYIALAAAELRKRHPSAVVVSGRPVAAGDIWNAEKGSYDKYLTVELKWTAA